MRVCKINEIKTAWRVGKVMRKQRVKDKNHFQRGRGMRGVGIRF